MLHFYGSCHQLPSNRNTVPDPTTRLLGLVNRLGLVRARDVANAVIPTVYLTHLVRARALDASPGVSTPAHRRRSANT